MPILHEVLVLKLVEIIAQIGDDLTLLVLKVSLLTHIRADLTNLANLAVVATDVHVETEQVELTLIVIDDRALLRSDVEGYTNGWSLFLFL